MFVFSVMQRQQSESSGAGANEIRKSCYEKHHNNNTNDVKNIHVSFSSLSLDRIIFTLQVDLG
jgi:hypothetical protein